MQLVDSHCHFDFAEFDQDRDVLWEQCRRSGIVQLVIPGVEPEQWEKALSVSAAFTGVWVSAGLHPWWLETAQLPKRDAWQQVLEKKSCVAVGECGLDAAIKSPMCLQESIFKQHIEMAIDHELPLIIHVRRAHNETIRLLKHYQPERAGVIHGFTGSWEIAMAYWKLGFYLGVGGSITYPCAHKTRATIQSMPLDALLLETDAPSMPLHGYQGQPNTPCQVSQVAKALAELRQQPLALIAQQTTLNSQQLFMF
jgi:TatD DNase family protein